MSMKFVQHNGFEEITRVLTSKNKGIFKLDGRCELYSCDKIPPSVSVSSSGTSSSSSSSSSGLTRGISSSSLCRGEEILRRGDEVITARRPRSSTIDHSPVQKQGRHRSKLQLIHFCFPLFVLTRHCLLSSFPKTCLTKHFICIMNK